MELKVRTIGTTQADQSALQSLMEATPDYARRVSGQEPQPGDAAGVLAAIPGDLDPEAKKDLGLWTVEEPSRLVAFADVLQHWPRYGVLHIGLLLVDEAHRRQGLGRRIHDEVEALARDLGDVRTLRMGIIEPNLEVAEPYWRALGYKPTGETMPFSDGAVDTTTSIWERPL